MFKRVCPRSCNRTLQIQDRHYQDPLLLPLWLLWRNCHLLCQESEFYHLYYSRICQDLYRWCRKCLNIFDIFIKWKKRTESVRESLDIMTFQFRYLQYFDISWSRQYDYKNLQGRLHLLKPVHDSKPLARQKRRFPLLNMHLNDLPDFGILKSNRKSPCLLLIKIMQALSALKFKLAKCHSKYKTKILKYPAAN